MMVQPSGFPKAEKRRTDLATDGSDGHRCKHGVKPRQWIAWMLVPKHTNVVLRQATFLDPAEG